jgi:hypothetical protein
MSEELTINIDRKAIVNKIQESLDGVIEAEMKSNEADVLKSIRNLFRKEMFGSESDLDDQLKWAVELAVKCGFDKAIKEIGLEDKVAEMTKVILSDDNMIMEIAKKKIEQSFGINR